MSSIGIRKDQAPLRRKLVVGLQGTLLAATLIIFLLLHVFAGTVLQRAGAADGPSSRQGLTLQRYD